MTLSQIREMIDNGPDGLGECDRCHTPTRLYNLPDSEPGDWQWCEVCLRQVAARKMVAQLKAGAGRRARAEALESLGLRHG